MNRIVNIRIALFLPLIISPTHHTVETAVLDPALYLYPSPPLFPSYGGSQEKDLWTRTSRSTKLDLPEELSTESKDTTTVTSTTIEQESMENAETFWPRLRSIDYALKPVHIPVTFTLSGNYGGYSGAGVIGNTYANIGGISMSAFGKSALAGSAYGNYGGRVYGGNVSPAWSGWGNGKWGHYGKG